LSLCACTTSVRRAALVPHQQPILRSGQGMGLNGHEVSLGSPTVASLTEPEVVEGENAGLVLPRWHLNGALRYQPKQNFDMGLILDWGLDAGSRALAEDQPDPDNGDVRGGGVSLGYSFQAGEMFKLGLGLDLILYSIPYVEYETCIDPLCLEPYTTIDRDRDTIPVMSLGIVPSWRLGTHWSAFAGANIRNHPTIRKGDIDDGIDIEEEEVESGPGNVVASAGIEFEMTSGLRAMAYMYQPVYMDPVHYGPTIGVLVTIPLSRDAPPSPAPAAVMNPAVVTQMPSPVPPPAAPPPPPPMQPPPMQPPSMQPPLPPVPPPY
jgi:hypothetical protein